MGDLRVLTESDVEALDTLYNRFINETNAGRNRVHHGAFSILVKIRPGDETWLEVKLELAEACEYSGPRSPEFAIFRRTGAVHKVGWGGAVEDDPWIEV